MDTKLQEFIRARPEQDDQRESAPVPVKPDALLLGAASLLLVAEGASEGLHPPYTRGAGLLLAGVVGLVVACAMAEKDN